MDLLLENGDFKRSPTGKPLSVSGLDELKQRVYIRLRAKPGVFIYDRRLGSNISEISENAGDEEILASIRKALPELFDAELVSVGFEKNNFTAKFRSEFGEFAVTIPIESVEE